MGSVLAAFGRWRWPTARMVVTMPDGWSFAQAACGAGGVPDGVLRPGRPGRACRPASRLLVHAAAGGVGMAAVQLARHLGARCSPRPARASGTPCAALGVRRRPDRVLPRPGLPGRFLAATGGPGVDVVLNALAGEFVDASLRPAAARRPVHRDGQGRRPRRGAGRGPAPGRALPGVRPGSRRARSGPQEMLAESWALFGGGALAPLPVRTWDVRAGGRGVPVPEPGPQLGKVVLTVAGAAATRTARCWSPAAPAALGALVARHLADRARRAAPAAGQPARPGRAGRGASWSAELAELGARGHAWRPATSPTASALAGAAGRVPAERPLTAVVHAAGVLDDGVIDVADARAGSSAVLRPKVDAALHLHELTAGAGPVGVRAVLLGGRRCRQRRAGQLRGGQRLPGRAGAAPPGAAACPRRSLAWGLWARGQRA